MLILCPYINAQSLNGKVYGSVIDKQSHTTLPGVNIVARVNDNIFGTVSDANGNFQFENIPVGRFDIEFSFIGYEKLIMQNVSLTSAKDLILEAAMTEKVETVDEIVVKAHKKQELINEFALISARTFTVEESNKYAGSWGDPARMASNFAGVVTAGDQRNDIIIRGNSPIGLLWCLDGIAIPNPNHFGSMGTTGGPINMLNNNQLANSDFFTGAYPAEFGNALSGVFDLKMRNGNQHQHEFIGAMGFNGFELGAEGPISKSKRSSYMVNFRYTMMDLMASMGMFDVGGIPKYADVSFKLFMPTKKMGTFSLIGVGGMSTITLESENDSLEANMNGWTSEMLPATHVKNGSKMGVLGLSHNYFFSEKSRIESSVSVSYSNSGTNVDRIMEPENFNFYNEDYNEINSSLASKFTLKHSARSTLQAGINVKRIDFDYFDETYLENEKYFVKGSDAKGNAMLYQAYIQAINRLSGQLTLNWGLHGQLFGLNKSKSIEPRAGLSYALNRKQKLSLGYGLHGQIQPLRVYFVQTPKNKSNSDYALTNQNLGLSKSHHLVAGYDWTIAPNLRFKMEAYYQHLFGIPVEEKASTFSMSNYGANFHNENTDSLINSGLGNNIGIEFTVEKYLSRNFYFLLTASVYNSKYRASDRVWRNTAFNGKHTLNVLAGYELPIKNDVLAISIKSVWAGGKRYIPVDLEQSQLAQTEVYDYSRAYDEKYNDYFRTDLRISFRQNLKRVTQEWSFDVQNLTNHKNIFTQRYDETNGKMVNIYQMGFFPIGSWKINF
jgi:hypothetical protein